MNKLGLAVVLLIFGATAALIAFIVYTILWNSSPIQDVLPMILRWLL
ncbi:hypothetical protein SJAV_10970 [Sulfurisphaera javensis]|uniref:Uncharacterized protein n=1 Tax=Sulfurisphaera javensis TaxID=2049879 RepID=A0AAT9GQG3_9CREN